MVGHVWAILLLKSFLVAILGFLLEGSHWEGINFGGGNKKAFSLNRLFFYPDHRVTVSRFMYTWCSMV